MMKTEIVQLNGANTGIGVEIVSTNKRRFVKYQDKIRIFKNLELAKTTCIDIALGERMEFYIIYKGRQIPVKDCYISNHSYEYIDIKNNMRYIFKDEVNLTVTSIGYLVFEDGDVIRCDKKYGYRRQKELMNYVIDMGTEMLGENLSIGRIEAKGYGNHTIFYTKNNTGQIHVVYNSKLMDINQSRKEKGDRVIPFVKQMDKFTTLFFYCVKDSFEPSRIGTDDIMKDTVHQLLEKLQTNIPETSPKIVDVEFSGYINVQED